MYSVGGLLDDGGAPAFRLEGRAPIEMGFVHDAVLAFILIGGDLSRSLDSSIAKDSVTTESLRCNPRL